MTRTKTACNRLRGRRGGASVPISMALKRRYLGGGKGHPQKRHQSRITKVWRAKAKSKKPSQKSIDVLKLEKKEQSDAKFSNKGSQPTRYRGHRPTLCSKSRR